jgi:hypothetical protein
MKNFLASLEKLNNELYVEKTIVETLECNGKIIEFIEFLKVLFLEMRSFLVLLNP